MTPDDMTPRDRRRELVRRSLMAAPRLSDRVQAKHLGVSRELVAKTRRALVAEGLIQPYPRTGRDGKTYRDSNRSRNRLQSVDCVLARLRRLLAAIDSPEFKSQLIHPADRRSLESLAGKVYVRLARPTRKEGAA